MIRPPAVPAFQDADYTAFGQLVQARTGIRLADYKAIQMRRRIGSLAQQAGCASFTDFYAAMECRPDLLAEFLDKMTINVSELLRNPSHFQNLIEKILPPLLTTCAPRALSVWSAGCSYGAEAYTLALLLHEQDAAVSILGTDLDQAILQKARLGVFTASDMLHISQERRTVHFRAHADGAHWVAAPHLRSHVQFASHDLLASPYPCARYDLIVCRNVVIYFTDEAKERVYKSFCQALKPGGILFIGGTERLTDHRRLGFEMVLPFFYRKPSC